MPRYSRLSTLTLGAGRSNLIVVGELSIGTLVSVVKVGGILRIRASERVIQLYVSLLMGLDFLLMLLRILKTAIGIRIEELIPWTAIERDVILTAQIMVTC